MMETADASESDHSSHILDGARDGRASADVNGHSDPCDLSRRFDPPETS
jgi:hypothetical protein